MCIAPHDLPRLTRAYNRPDVGTATVVAGTAGLHGDVGLRGRAAVTLRALKVVGPFKGPSGYDHHTREFVRELVRQGVAVELVDLPNWGPARLSRRQREPWFESLDKPTGARVVLHFTMPHQVQREPGRVHVNYTMFEATRIPPHWAAQSLTHDLVVLPTRSSQNAWVSSGVTEDTIRLCPLGISPAVYGRSAEPLPLQLENGEPVSQFRVRLLNVSEIAPRKNLVGLIRVWIKATTRDDDAILVLKLGNYAVGQLELLRLQLGEIQEQLGKSLDEAAPIHFTFGILSDDAMPRLYASATHYISMSFGEGWDLAMCEAGASGLKLIAPDHSAYHAYLDPSVARMILSREVPAVFPGPTGELFKDAHWWEPDEMDAVAAIREAIEGRDGTSSSARERILQEITWEKATRRLIGILSEAESAGGRSWTDRTRLARLFKLSALRPTGR